MFNQASSVIKRRAKYDVIFGDGVGPDGRFIFNLNPNGLARVIFYTPTGAPSGPTPKTFNGVVYQTYTHNLLSGCKALMRTATVDYKGTVTAGTTYGDWLLFPQGTLRMVTDTNGESAFGDCNSISGVSKKYPVMFGTYDSTDMYNQAKWNKARCIFDFSAWMWPMNGGSMFLHLGRNEQFYCFNSLGVRTAIPGQGSFYTNSGFHRGFCFERCIGDGAGINADNGYVGTLGIVIQSITVSGTTATIQLPNTTSALTSTSTLITNLVKACNDTSAPLHASVYGFTGAVATAYNTILNTTGPTLTYVSATQVSYQLNSNPGGVLPTGSGFLSFRQDLMPDIAMTTDWVENQCGFQYVGNSQGAHAFALLVSSVKRFRRYQRVNHHNGWGRRNANRTTVSYATPATTTPITSANQSGGVMTLLTPNTKGLTTGNFVLLANSKGKNAIYPVLSSVNNVSLTCSCDPAAAAYFGGVSITGYISGNTLTISTITAPNTAVINGTIVSGVLTVNSVLSGTVKAGQIVGYAGVTSVTAGSVLSGSGVTWTLKAASGQLIPSDVSNIPMLLTGGNGLTPDIYTGQSVIGSGMTQASIVAGGVGFTWPLNGSAQTIGSAGSPLPLSLCINYGNPEANGFSCMQGDPPDLFSHGDYFSNGCMDVKLYDTVNSWDCCNQKYTGGPYYIENTVDIRCPMSFAYGSFGNDDVELGFSWMQGSSIRVLNHLQVFSEDLQPSQPRSYGPWFVTANFDATSLSNSLILNAMNGTGSARAAFSTGGPQGPAGYANLNLLYGYNIDNAIISSWGPADASQQDQAAKTYNQCFTEDATALPSLVPANGSGAIVPSTSNHLISTTSPAFQAKIAVAESLSIAGSFRLSRPELAGVVVVGDGSATDLETELNVLEFMAAHPEMPWARWLMAHFKADSGLGR